jgi:hypothetical protein
VLRMASKWSSGRLRKIMKRGSLDAFDCDGNRLTVFRHPSGDTLSELNPEVVHHIRMRIFRGPQHQLPLLENINEVGIARNDGGYKFHNAAQHHVKRVSGGNPATDLVQKINGRQAVAKTCHGRSGWGHPVHARSPLARELRFQTESRKGRLTLAQDAIPGLGSASPVQTRFKNRLGSATTLYGTVALSFVIPSKRLAAASWKIK